MNLSEQLTSLSKGQILDIFKALNGGSVGFDHERSKKHECIERLLSQHGEEKVAGVLNGPPINTAAAPAPTVEKVIAVGGPKVAPQPSTSEAASTIASVLDSLVRGAVNEERVREIVSVAVKEALEQSPVVTIEVKRPDGSTHTVEGHTRTEFQRILRRAIAGQNQLLVGPAGCGKTHLAHQVAEALGRPFASISCTAGMSESSLSGWMLPGPGGEFVYVPSDFVTIYEGGGVFLFDEVDAADSNTLLFINQALANGSFYLPQRKGATQVKRHPDAVIMAAANTYGTGANMVYAGRERLDESTLDRFRAGMTVLDYDADFERKSVDPEVLAWGWAVRARIREARLSRVLSTRFLLDATKLLAAGETFEEVRETYFVGWKAEERAKVEV